MNALAGLMNPQGIGQGVQQAFEAGRQRRVQTETRNALASLVTNPGDTEALTNLARYNPEAAMQMQARGQQMQAQQAEAKKQELYGAAAQGDNGALLQLWGVDPDSAMKLDERQKKLAVEGYNALAQIALGIDQMPQAQRHMAWDQGIDRLVGMGFDGLAQYRGGYSEQALQSVVARAGEMQTLIGNRRPSYTAIPEGGTLVNIRDPRAVSEFGATGQPAQPVIRPADTRPPGKSNGDLYTEAREAIANGADAAAVNAQLIEWGVAPL